MLKEDAEIGRICVNEGSSGSIGIANKETQRDKHQYQRQQLTGLRDGKNMYSTEPFKGTQCLPYHLFWGFFCHLFNFQYVNPF